MFAKELHAQALIGIEAQSHPDEVEMVGHQTVGWAEKAFTRRSVEHDFAKESLERLVEPTGTAHGNRHRPVDDGVTLVVLTWQTRQTEASVDSLAV